MISPSAGLASSAHARPARAWQATARKTSHRRRQPEGQLLALAERVRVAGEDRRAQRIPDPARAPALGDFADDDLDRSESVDRLSCRDGRGAADIDVFAGARIGERAHVDDHGGRLPGQGIRDGDGGRARRPRAIEFDDERGRLGCGDGWQCQQHERESEDETTRFKSGHELSPEPPGPRSLRVSGAMRQSEKPSKLRGKDRGRAAGFLLRAAA